MNTGVGQKENMWRFLIILIDSANMVEHLLLSDTKDTRPNRM